MRIIFTAEVCSYTTFCFVFFSFLFFILDNFPKLRLSCVLVHFLGVGWGGRALVNFASVEVNVSAVHYMSCDRSFCFAMPQSLCPDRTCVTFCINNNVTMVSTKHCPTNSSLCVCVCVCVRFGVGGVHGVGVQCVRGCGWVGERERVQVCVCVCVSVSLCERERVCVSVSLCVCL